MFGDRDDPSSLSAGSEGDPASEFMKASEIRRRFLDYFQLRGHELLPSSSLVPADDPTLLFTNAGMVQFKKVFLGQEQLPYKRAVTSQKCVRAGGKHNDLEQVGETARHHTFFEMLGNFSFGDYFKRDAIHFAWEFLTVEMGLDPDRLFATVHHTDDEAFGLWQDVTGLPASRIYRLGDEDNFWQMADTGPCGPCSEVHYDQRPDAERSVPDADEFEVLGEAGLILELWNLVFMQFDRDAQGTLHPLPAPSIDTGLGLERLAAVLQQADSNYHTDLFRPLLDRVSQVVGREYDPESREGVSFRVLADHARAVAFLVADGVHPSSEGRGYVLRRILRRAVRHAWLLGKREPTLTYVVEEVVRTMSGAYPELARAEELLLRTTRREEERFLRTIEGGMVRFDELAPVPAGAEGAGEADAGEEGGDERTRLIPGDEAFRLYDTFGFPLDLTQVMARERGYRVDVEGFEAALEEQRARSRADRTASGVGLEAVESLDDWTLLKGRPPQRWVGWERTRAETRVLGFRREEGEDPRLGLILEENPFYVEAGGQVSDTGGVEGDGWRMSVEDVRRVGNLVAVVGSTEGTLPEDLLWADVLGRVDEPRRRDIERNHTATHLLHAALREVLGEHVTQRGSLVAPDRLRFDFSHPAALTEEELEAVEARVNAAIWRDHPVEWEIVPHAEAIRAGAMALFGEKYGDEVRVVRIPDVSLELCGGTHLRHTGAAGPFTVVRESGVAAGVRRIEAFTGPGAYRRLRSWEEKLLSTARLLRASPENLEQKARQLVEEKEGLESLLEEVRREGATPETMVHEAVIRTGDEKEVTYRGLRLRVRDADDARNFGDAFREREEAAVAVVATETPDGASALFVFVTDDLIGRGIRAGNLVREIAQLVGGRGGGRSHMAQGGIENEEKVDEALVEAAEILRRALAEVPEGAR
jgi:alanyl-tRNA synthetase